MLSYFLLYVQLIQMMTLCYLSNDDSRSASNHFSDDDWPFEEPKEEATHHEEDASADEEEGIGVLLQLHVVLFVFIVIAIVIVIHTKNTKVKCCTETDLIE